MTFGACMFLCNSILRSRPSGLRIISCFASQFTLPIYYDDYTYDFLLFHFVKRSSLPPLLLMNQLLVSKLSLALSFQIRGLARWEVILLVNSRVHVYWLLQFHIVCSYSGPANSSFSFIECNMLNRWSYSTSTSMLELAQALDWLQIPLLTSLGLLETTLLPSELIFLLTLPLGTSRNAMLGWVSQMLILSLPWHCESLILLLKHHSPLPL